MDTHAVMPYGDQRVVFIQLTSNGRRLKRKGRKRLKCTLSLKERVCHVFCTGKLKDYTHPKEIDPFWDILYRQYEALVYIEIYYRRSIKYQTEPLTDEEIYTIYKTLCLIRSYKKMLVHYLHNFMYLMYGSVMSRRFYGWTKYMDRFISSFKELSVKNINYLKFDANKTRCSVYFFQAFWLHGLNIVNDITNYRKKRYCTGEGTDGGDNWVFDNIDEDNMFYDENFTSFLISDTDEEIVEEPEVSVVEEKEKIVICECSEDFDFDAVLEDEDKENHNPEKRLVQIDNEDKDNEAKEIIREILFKIGLPSDYLYNAEDRQIKKIGKLIRKKLKDNELNLTDAQFALLREVVYDR